ncbi:hypothetical protein BT69DRAFT_1350226 [Atractiella rhizophila]|nr:hypothetical protein BT69DRAFT_1350226 [Atractiella rhizophila]
MHVTSITTKRQKGKVSFLYPLGPSHACGFWPPAHCIKVTQQVSSASLSTGEKAEREGDFLFRIVIPSGPGRLPPAPIRFSLWLFKTVIDYCIAVWLGLQVLFIAPKGRRTNTMKIYSPSNTRTNDLFHPHISSSATTSPLAFNVGLSTPLPPKPYRTRIRKPSQTPSPLSEDSVPGLGMAAQTQSEEEVEDVFGSSPIGSLGSGEERNTSIQSESGVATIPFQATRARNTYISVQAPTARLASAFTFGSSPPTRSSQGPADRSEEDARAATSGEEIAQASDSRFGLPTPPSSPDLKGRKLRPLPSRSSKAAQAQKTPSGKDKGGSGKGTGEKTPASAYVSGLHTPPSTPTRTSNLSSRSETPDNAQKVHTDEKDVRKPEERSPTGAINTPPSTHTTTSNLPSRPSKQPNRQGPESASTSARATFTNANEFGSALPIPPPTRTNGTISNADGNTFKFVFPTNPLPTKPSKAAPADSSRKESEKVEANGGGGKGRQRPFDFTTASNVPTTTNTKTTPLGKYSFNIGSSTAPPRSSNGPEKPAPKVDLRSTFMNTPPNNGAEKIPAPAPGVKTTSPYPQTNNSRFTSNIPSTGAPPAAQSYPQTNNSRFTSNVPTTPPPAAQYPQNNNSRFTSNIPAGSSKPPPSERCRRPPPRAKPSYVSSSDNSSSTSSDSDSDSEGPTFRGWRKASSNNTPPRNPSSSRPPPYSPPPSYSSARPSASDRASPPRSKPSRDVFTDEQLIAHAESGYCAGVGTSTNRMCGNRSTTRYCYHHGDQRYTPQGERLHAYFQRQRNSQPADVFTDEQLIAHVADGFCAGVGRTTNRMCRNRPSARYCYHHRDQSHTPQGERLKAYFQSTSSNTSRGQFRAHFESPKSGNEEAISRSDNEAIAHAELGYCAGMTLKNNLCMKTAQVWKGSKYCHLHGDQANNSRGRRLRKYWDEKKRKSEETKERERKRKEEDVRKKHAEEEAEYERRRKEKEDWARKWEEARRKEEEQERRAEQEKERFWQKFEEDQQRGKKEQGRQRYAILLGQTRLLKPIHSFRSTTSAPRAASMSNFSINLVEFYTQSISAPLNASRPFSKVTWPALDTGRPIAPSDITDEAVRAFFERVKKCIQDEQAKTRDATKKAKLAKMVTQLAKETIRKFHQDRLESLAAKVDGVEKDELKRVLIVISRVSTEFK